jgi:hypothetical protein
MNPIDSLQLFSKVSTGMVLLMNLTLLISIRMALRWAKQSAKLDSSDEAASSWRGARRTLMALIIFVVAMNGIAVYANHRLTKATQAVAIEFPDAESPLVLSQR